MGTEIEAKFRVSEDGFEKLREELGVPKIIRKSTLDSYFDLGDRPGALRMRTEYFDERPSEAVMTFKRKISETEEGLSEREEYEPHILPEQRKDWMVIFAAMGYEPDVEVYKRREKVNLAMVGIDFQVCFDEVTDLGNFVEVEFAKGVTREQAKRAIETLLFHWKDFGLTPERESYQQLALAAKRAKAS